MSRGAVVTLLLLLPCSPAPAAQGELWAHTVRAVGLMAEGKLEAAIGELARARAARAAPELDALVGLAALQGGEAKPARRQLEGAIRRGSSEPLVLYWAARAALAQGDRRAALRRLQQALAIASESREAPAIYLAYAVALHELGQPKAALSALREAARRRPNLLDPTLYPTPVEGAIGLMVRVLAAFPAKLQLLRTEGHLLWRSGRVVASCDRFRQLLSRRSGDPDALEMMARCEAAMGRAARGLTLASRAIEKAPTSPQALATRGELLLELGQASKAVTDLKKAADALPRDARLLTRLAEACTLAEQPSCAKKFFAYALRRAPLNAAAAFGLALHLQQGAHAKKPEEQARARRQTEAMFRKALALAPWRPRYWRAAANFAHLIGERRLAARWSREAKQAEQTQRRLKQIQQQMSRISRAASQLGACKKSCSRLGAGLPTAARQFLRLGGSSAIPDEATTLLPCLRSRVLFLEDPTTYELKARTLAGQSYTVRSTFPYVPPWRLARP